MKKHPLSLILKKQKNLFQQNLNNKAKKKSNNKSIKSSNNPINITTKINYKFYNNNPIAKVGINYNNQSKEKYYWFAAYDKLIKTRKLLKLFSFYNIASQDSISLGSDKLYNDFSQIKEKKLEIKDYEIYFIKNKGNKPFIRKSEGNLIYVKLYLLNMKQLNMIYSYINKIEYDEYFQNLDNIIEKDKYLNIFNENNLNINYPTIYCLGSFMNIGIYSFSRYIKDNEILNPNNSIDLNLIPNSKKIAKLIKILLMNFPEYSKEYFIDYIFNYIKHVPNSNDINAKILLDKKNEINHLLISKKKSLYKLNSGGVFSGMGSKIPENSFSPYLSSFNNNNSNKLSSNTNNNIFNNINNNNLGTISYNASCFDFTSDFIISMRQNEENISKILDSIKNLSNQNKNTFSKNNDSNPDNKSSSLSNVDKINNNEIKQPNSDINLINNKNVDSKISNFSVDRDSKLNPKNSIKINVNRKMNIIMNNKKKKNVHLTKDLIKKIQNYQIPKLHTWFSKNNNSMIIYKPHTSFRSNKKSLIINTPQYSSDNIDYIKIFNNDNKENCNSLSNFDEIYLKNSKKFFNLSKGNKSYIKGEDIFQSTSNYKRNSNSTCMYIFDKNGVQSFDYKNIQKSKKFRLSSTNQLSYYQ